MYEIVTAINNKIVASRAADIDSLKLKAYAKKIVGY